MIGSPMLADTLDSVDKVQFPVYASFKIDGCRGRVDGNGVLTSRKGLTFPNKRVNLDFGSPAFAWLDGELVAGDIEPNDPAAFNKTMRVLSKAENPQFCKFYVFDLWGEYGTLFGFQQRHHRLAQKVKELNSPQVVFLEHQYCDNPKILLDYEEFAVSNGFEGLILRSVDGAYKNGRSTVLERGMLKLKRFIDFEVEVKEVLPGYTNQNPAEKDAWGKIKRSTAKSGKVQTGSAGSLVVTAINGPFKDVTFQVGIPYQHEADLLWANRHEIAQRYGSVKRCIGKVKCQLVGTVNKPRFPQWLGPREPWDL